MSTADQDAILQSIEAFTASTTAYGETKASFDTLMTAYDEQLSSMTDTDAMIKIADLFSEIAGFFRTVAAAQRTGADAAEAISNIFQAPLSEESLDAAANHAGELGKSEQTITENLGKINDGIADIRVLMGGEDK